MTSSRIEVSSWMFPRFETNLYELGPNVWIHSSREADFVKKLVRKLGIVRDGKRTFVVQISFYVEAKITKKYQDVALTGRTISIRAPIQKIWKSENGGSEKNCGLQEREKRKRKRKKGRRAAEHESTRDRARLGRRRYDGVVITHAEAIWILGTLSTSIIIH